LLSGKDHPEEDTEKHLSEPLPRTKGEKNVPKGARNNGLQSFFSSRREKGRLQSLKELGFAKRENGERHHDFWKNVVRRKKSIKGGRNHQWVPIPKENLPSTECQRSSVNKSYFRNKAGNNSPY